MSLFTTTGTGSGTPSAPSQPTGITAQSVGSDTATIAWNPSVDPNGDEVTYKVRYRETGVGGWSEVETTTETSYALTGLKAETTYDLRLIATDGVLWISRNTMSLFTTTATLPAAFTWRGLVADGIQQAQRALGRL